MNNIFIRLVSFPCIRTYGTTVMDSNGDYNIYLDARLSASRMRATLTHEITHIKKGHFSDTVSASQAETEV
jgi:predicted metal-dependent peptidase